MVLCEAVCQKGHGGLTFVTLPNTGEKVRRRNGSQGQIGVIAASHDRVVAVTHVDASSGM